MKRSMKLSEIQKDALKEVCTMGFGHAATALSQLIDRKVLIDVPRVEILPLEKVPEVLGGAEKLIVAVYDRVLGDIKGGILFMMPFMSAKALVAAMEYRFKEGDLLNEKSCELLKRVGSVVSSAFLSALVRFIGISAVPVGVSISFDMAGGIIETAVAEMSIVSDYAILIDSSLKDEDKEIEAYLLFVPEPASLEAILERIGVE